MIGFLQGTIQDSSESFLTVNVQGVGYIVYVTAHTMSQSQVTESVALYVHTIVREQNLDLYGFIDQQEKRFFELLINISGIGPKVALSILNATTTSTLSQAVVSRDSTILTKVSGIGKKNAEKIIIELENKIDPLWLKSAHKSSPTDNFEVMEALESLGYSSRKIQDALRDTSLHDLDTSTKIRRIIKILSR